jgi:heme-degrading monooxygenase HmoA
MDEAVGILRDSVVPAAREQKGYRGHYLLTDRTNNKGIAISLCETEDDMTSDESSDHYRQQLAKFRGIFAAPPVGEGYEVSVQL